MERPKAEDIEHVRGLIDRRGHDELAQFLNPLHAADVAEILSELDSEQQVTVLKGMGNERAAEVLTEIDETSGQALLLLLSDLEVVDLLEELPSADAADLMSTLPPEKTRRVGDLLPSEERHQLQELMEFDEETAGGIMELERIAVPDDVTIGSAIEVVREAADEIENLQKIYVVDASGCLQGTIGVMDLIVHPPATAVRDIMETNVISVTVDMDQEDVASIFGKYDEFTLPVVDAANKLVGRITVDDIIDVIEEEASEDIARIAGTTEEELAEPSPLKVSRTRLPWLITGLVGQGITAVLMSHFEASLQTWVVLAFFVPLIVGTAGSIGIQAAIVVVRQLALGQFNILRMGRRVMKELSVAVINGLILGVLLFLFVLFWQRDIMLGVLLGGSLLTVILVSGLVGASLPLLFHRWHIDPAIATGPLITVSNDIIGLAIYLSMTTFYFSQFR